jgi:hypothetical protein
MADETEVEVPAAIADEDSKVWRPSGKPAHRAGPTAPAAEGRIVEQQDVVGIFGAVARVVKRPFVRLVIGLGIFILAAIVYDKTVNYGSWTERAAKPKASKHVDAVPKTPE